MKIFVNARFLTQPVSGVQRYAIECSRKIKKIWPETRFLAPKNIWNAGIAEELEAEIVGHTTGYIWEQTTLPRFAAANGYLPLFNPCNLAPIFYKKNFTTIHDLAFYHHPGWNSKKFSSWYNIMMPRVARRSLHIFTVSNTTASEIQKAYRLLPVRVSVTYNGISASMLPTEKPEKEKIILSVGTFNIRKNQRRLVLAFLQSEIRHTHRLVLVGDRNRAFRDAGISETDAYAHNIEVLTGLSEKELAAWNSRAEIAASVSLYEGFGIPLLEGLAYGCKLLCSDIPVYRELYHDVSAFCDPESIESIAAALDKLSSAAAPAESLRQELLARYNYDVAAKIITDAICSAAPG